MHKHLTIMTMLVVGTSTLLQQAQAAQNLSSLMVEIRQQDGIPHYYNLASGMPLNGEISIIRDNQGYTQATFSQGLPNGRWQVFHPNNAKLIEGQYFQGYQNGSWRMYDLSGQMTELQVFNKGVPEGEWQTFDSNGRLNESVFYRSGNKELVKRFYASGKLKASETYTDNLRHGQWQSFYENGTLAQSQQYANNQLFGEYLEQNAQGGNQGQGPIRCQWPTSGRLAELF
ncbi:toxin-antitoxin system YwqK family antitoxin [Shewanella indica]|uniref:toxin-antitoxin system YwqK family antitoxin n=1 Tax=Shewanella indica TaxID=768528 RepID=UPI001F2F2B7A|nr:toxin-antitoxin system YwqK family antitoxin [Shewanella indica]